MRLKFSLNSLKRALQPNAATNTGLFGNSLLKSPQGFSSLADQVESKATELIREIVGNADQRAKDPNAKTTVNLVDDLSNEVCKAADLTDCVRSMHCDPNYGKAAEDAMRRFTYLVETMNTLPELYLTLKKSLEKEGDRLDEISRRTANLLIEDFESSGVHLDDDKRRKFVALSDEIFDAGARFYEGIDQPVTLTNEEISKYRVSIDLHHLTSSWINSHDQQLRRFIYAKFYQHSEKQEHSLKRLISARDQMAKLTGFQSFAHRAQSNSVLGSYERIHAFLEKTIEKFSPLIDGEIDETKKILRDNRPTFPVMSHQLGKIGEWDVEFASVLRGQMLLSKIGRIKDFFHLETMLSGFEMIVNRLYGLQFKALLPDPGEVWPGNVLKINVHRDDSENAFLGTIFLDIDVRPSKIQGDCHYTVRCSKLLDNGEFQTPVVVVSLSVASQELQNQSIEKVLETVTMNPHQADNFFHEMGHAIHSILGRTRFQHVAGTRCPTDFAEVPSHLMECYFNDPQILRQICKDKSGRPLSQDEAEVIVESRKTFGGICTLQQVVYSMFDLEAHGFRAETIANGSIRTTDLFGELYAKALPNLDKPENFAYHQRVSHLVTYGARYYSYLVAKASASLIYQNLFAEDPFSRENGQRWAKAQSFGGEYPSDHLLKPVLGEIPNIEQLTDVLRKTATH